MKVGVIIPALDEERAIGGVLAGLEHPEIIQIVVGDNGSRDRTAQIARSFGADVVGVPERGYGAACAGALGSLRDEVDTVLFVDADGSDDLSETESLLGPIRDGRADLVIGSRALGRVEPGALTPQQRFGNWLATRLIRILYRHRYADLGPFRAIRRSTLEQIGMRDRRYGWTVEMQIRALQIGAIVLEVPAAYRRRVGRSKISGTITGVMKAGFWIVWTIVREVRVGRRETGDGSEG